MQIPINPYTLEDTELCLLLKFKPPRIPKKSKKIHNGIFQRSMKPFIALYHVSTELYIVSLLPEQVDVNSWIDNNIKTIEERVNAIN